MTRSRDGGGFWGFALMFTGAMGMFFLLPGVLVVYWTAAAVGTSLDAGQLWVLGGTVSGVVVLAAWFARGPVFALGWYAGACLVVAWLLAFAFWGMHEEWPHDFIRQAIPGLRG